MGSSAVPDIESSAPKTLIEGERGDSLWLVPLNPEARRVVLRSSPAETPGRERLLIHLPMAAGRYLPQTPATGRT